MEKDELRQFLEKSKTKEPESQVNWELHKNKWIEYVNSLYTNIDEWLHDFVSNHMLRISRETIELSEEDIGKYNIDKYIISIENYQITLEPLGTMIIGAWGRIDMIGYLIKH